MSPTSSPAAVKRAAVRFDLDGRPFPLPLLHGSVGGVPTWMVVDTGASSHVIAGWLARKLGSSIAPAGNLATDHAGREIPTSFIEHPAISIDDWGPIADRPTPVAETPAPIEKLGIGAFISPQSLGEGSAVVLDLRHREMYPSGYADAERALGSEGRRISPVGSVVCEETDGWSRGVAYVVPATIEDQRAMLLVDTGSDRTDLLVGSRAANALASRSVANNERRFAASGRIETRTLKGTLLTVGEWSGRKDIDLIPGVSDDSCPRDGVVSMDVLATCILVLGPEKMLGTCSDR
jgi:aspartyl protease